MNIQELKTLQEKIIKKSRSIDKIRNVVFGILLILLIAICLLQKEIIIAAIFGGLFSLIVILCIFGIIKSCVVGNDINIFNKNFKNIFVKTSLQNYFNDLTYEYEKGFEESFVRQTGMLDTGDRYYSNDYVSGIYKNIKFEQADIHIEEKHEEKDDEGNKRTVWETLFMGKLMIFDFNKPFKANLQISSAFFDSNRLPWGKQFTNVKTENIEFNKNFAIYAENELEAFYILTPHFMEKIQSVYKSLNCSIMFGFMDNKLYIAVDNYDDSFEYNVFEPINEEKIKEEILKDIKTIINLVEELDLDNNLFKKVIN